MKLREKPNLKSLKEPTFGEDDEDESMASEQDDTNYSGREISTDEDDPEEDYRHFAHSDTPTLMQQPTKSSRNKRVVANKKAAGSKKSTKKTLSSSNLKKSEYFNDENEEEESSQDVPLLKVKKKGATSSKPKPKNGLKSVENNVDDLLSSEMEPKKNSKPSKSNSRPKKQVIK